MKRITILVALTLAGCGGASSDPAPAPAAPPVIVEAARGATFFDNFNRADGSLSNGFDMRGGYVSGYPLPAATDGFIKGNRYTYAGKSVVYASQRLRSNVTRLGAVGRWSALQSTQSLETGIAIVISANSNLISDMLHFVIGRSGWELTMRKAGGNFDPVASGTFSPILNLGQDYVFEIEVTASAILVRTPTGTTEAHADTTGILGPYVFWEEYPNVASPANAFEFDAVWAVETGRGALPAAGLTP